MDETEDVPEPTQELSAVIRPIEKDTVHKICSGQVVLSLAVAVKELVENAIDAGATLVEVKLRDQGLDAVEVSDNGSGVEEHNFESLTAKYHTSKIREFSDLQSVETFGFRGEALSSLCALSDMTITTRHKSSEVAVKLELDHEGKIRKRLPCARSIGTTVHLTNLFSTLPVRRRDFVRNIKKEFTKMCQILQAYCLIAKGVRIMCSNQTPKGGKTTVLQSQGSENALENISAIFGSRQIENLVELKSPFSGDDDGSSWDQLSEGLPNDTDEQMCSNSEDIRRLYATQFKLEGYVSRCSHGAGRSSKDRQYFYINSRPCEPKNVAKVVNEFYHRYNVQQYPFVYLNIMTPRAEVDVNLTPDKRQLLINNEQILLLVIKRALLSTYGSTPSTFKMQNTTITSMLGNKEISEKSGSCPSVESEDDQLDVVPISSAQRFFDVLSQWKHTGDTAGIAPHVPAKRKCPDEITVRTLKLRKIQEFLKNEESKATIEPAASYKSESEEEEEEEEAKKRGIEDSPLNKGNKTNNKEFSQSGIGENKEEKENVENLPFGKIDEPGSTRNANNQELLTDLEDYDKKTTIELDESTSDTEFATCAFGEIRTSLEAIEQHLKAEESILKEEGEKRKLSRLRFKSEISPSQNKNAESELQKEITKACFARMNVVGQFNLGFIVVQLDSDLFIVDQHATDEKYNFEMLQRTTELQYQTLAVPLTLELTAVNEMVLIDNLALFEKNGFKFEIDNDAPPTRKIRLLGKPFSKNWEFGKEDIDELLFMLQDAPEKTMCRPSRIRSMFASRACRKSVMIGTALKRSTMKTLITHMGEIDQPWNCPHGRPTMRHLINTAILLNNDNDDDDNSVKPLVIENEEEE